MDQTSPCGHPNRAGARFCSECGAPLALACPSCGSEPRPGARFCDSCGASLEAVPAPAPAVASPASTEAERKQVTVLFSDLARSMDLAEQFDPDTWRDIVTGLFEISAEAVRRYGGTVDKFTGDGLMALFGAPVAQEDHASRAAHAGLALISAARDYAAKIRAEHAVDLHVRVGLNSGEVVAGDVGESGFTAVGHTVGLAQRMESQAALDSVCISEHTARLLGAGFTLHDPGRITVKGASQPIGVFRLQPSAEQVETARRPLTTTRLVGREVEIDALGRALDDALRGRAQVIGIVGEAGAGKSRLTEELAMIAADRGVRVRRTAGVSHASDVPLLPIRLLFADYFGISITDSPEAARQQVERTLLAIDPELADELPVVFDFLDLRDPARPPPPVGPDARRRRILATIQRVTHRRSAAATVVFVLEDLHWFDQQSIAFLDDWLPSFPGTRTLFVTNFRPEFRPPWARQSYYRQIPLAGLDPQATRAMVGELLGVDPSLGPLAEDLAGRAGGNPLFVEEMVRDLSEDGTLAGTPGSYLLARPIDSVRMPMSVHAVLAGRIDRLDPAHKQLLQAASVIGREFAIGVLAATLGSGEPELHGGLHELCRAELLQQTGDGEFRFWHPLTQEVAYSGLLSATRRRRHRAAADALIQLSPGRLDELSPLIARHMEQSGDRLEAGRWQSRAAVWAMRGDIAEVLRRVEAAIEHLDAVQQDEQRAEALRLAVWARAFLLRVASRVGLDPTVARDLAERARTDAEQIGDPVLLTSVSMMEGVFHIWSGDAGRARDAMTDAMLRAGESGDESLQAWAFGAGASAYCYAGPVDEGIRRITHGLELCADDASIGLQHAGYNVRDSAKMLSALLYLAGGRLDDARQAMHAANDFLRTRVVLDWLVWNLSMFPVLADITGHPDDLAAAIARVDEMGPLAEDSGSVLSRVHLLRARGLLALQLNRADAALESFADAIAVMRDRGSGRHEEVSVLAELARAHLACGDVTDAVDAAREATRFAASSGANLPGCQAYATLAHVLRRAAPEGAHSQVRTVITTGLALAEQNNATTWLAFLAEERARLDGGDLAAVADGYDAIGATGHAARIRAELAG